MPPIDTDYPNDSVFDVFLCHNSADKAAVKQIGEQLKQHGLKPWLDEWELRPGFPWQRLLEAQITSIKSAAVFVGNEGFGPWQRQELEAFLREFTERNCPVIPVLLPTAPQQPTLPTFLRGHMWVDFRQANPDPLEQLIWGITGERQPIQTHTKQALPMQPESIENLWQNAQLAYYGKQWAQAETYLRQVLAIHPHYKDAPAKLTEVIRQLQVQTRYQEIANLRATDAWEEVLTRLYHLTQEQPDVQDTLGLRDWAKSRQRRQHLYDSALAAFDAKNWTAARTALEAVLKEFPGDGAAQNLLARAHAEQQAEVHPAHLIQSGQIAPALDQIEHILMQVPHDPEAILMLHSLIELIHIPLELRHRSATLLARAGDPRPGVRTLEPAWCEVIPSGEYPLDQNAPVVRLNRFRIARYPVTVGQFREFWERGGYAEERWWTPQGWDWKQQKKVSEPFRWTDPEWTLANQPVIGVSWYEAAAFCRWLTERGREAGWLAANERIRLPTEAEWEVAAMWDAQQGQMQRWQPPDGASWQNVEETGIGSTLAVGLFPQGGSSCGAQDMAGNVWEWCASAYSDYPQAATQVQQDFPASERGPVLRGGSWTSMNARAGWDARDGAYPTNRPMDWGFRVCVIDETISRQQELQDLWEEAKEAQRHEDFQKAENLLQQIEVIDPEYLSVKSRLRYVKNQKKLKILREELRDYRKKRDWEAVLIRINEILSIDPSYKGTEEYSEWARKQQKIAQLYEHASNAFKSKDWAMALDILKKLLGDEPEHIEAQKLFALANSHSRQQCLWVAQITGTLDTRIGVCTLKLDWCDIFPEEEYILPDSPELVNLQSFQIARYPVTVWQFRQFLEAGGYNDRHLWTPEGWGWKARDPTVTQPYKWNDRDLTLNNQPVVGVSWYEAMAFCAWLDRVYKSRGWLTEKERIRLPSEAEWVVAAMWDVQSYAAKMQELKKADLSDNERLEEKKKAIRRWQQPQGEIWQNVQEANIGRPTPVGLFPQGVSPCGALDMAGNVWEWCGSAYNSYPTEAFQEDFLLSAEDLPALRGGSHISSSSNGWNERTNRPPDDARLDCGFRVCLSFKKNEE